MSPRVLVLFNEPTLPPEHPDSDSEHDILFTADAVARILQQAGIAVERLGLRDDPAALLKGLSASNPDAVFNLYEGLAQWGNTEAYVAGLLELLRVPFTGSPTQPLLMCRSKPLTKQLLAGAGLPTAPFFVVEDGPVPRCRIKWPVIVKPGREDASVGIDQASVVTGQKQLEDRVEYIRATYGPSVLVERFVGGREFNVALLERGGELTTLPYSEILFVPPAERPDLWPIVSFDAKWRPGTLEFTATPAKNPADVTPELHDRIATLSKRAFELVGCRDYARVDFRLDEEGEPFILEVNPNPCISPLAGLAAGLESAKIPYAEFIVGLVQQALRRGPSPQLAEELGTTFQVAQAVTEAAALPEQAPSSICRVRSARQSDLAGILDLLSGTDTVHGEPTAAFVARVRLVLERKDPVARRCILLTRRGAVVGLALSALLDGAEGAATLEAVFVRPGHRLQGHGRRLARAAEESATAGGARLLLAHASSGPTEAMPRQFLQHVGFRSVGELAEYYRDGYARLSFARVLTPPRPESPAVAPPAETPVAVAAPGL